jgi:hypothetical protein
LPDEYLSEYWQIRRDDHFHLTLGREYTVYAVVGWVGGFWYFVADDDFSYYPVWHPAPLFEITDGGISPLWRAGSGNGGKEPILAPREWAENPVFYDRLTDRDPDAVAEFQRLKQVMDSE